MRLAVFTGHVLMPLKFAQLSASYNGSKIYKHSIWTKTIEDDSEDSFDIKINEFVIDAMNQAAEYVRTDSGGIVELHHWSDVNLGYVGENFPSLYDPSNYIKSVGDVFLLNNFENIKLKRVFVSGDLSTIDAASEAFSLSSGTGQLDFLSSKYTLKSTERQFMGRFTRPLSASSREISTKKECTLDFDVVK